MHSSEYLMPLNRTGVVGKLATTNICVCRRSVSGICAFDSFACAWSCHVPLVGLAGTFEYLVYHTSHANRHSWCCTTMHVFLAHLPVPPGTGAQVSPTVSELCAERRHGFTPLVSSSPKCACRCVLHTDCAQIYCCSCCRAFQRPVSPDWYTFLA